MRLNRWSATTLPRARFLVGKLQKYALELAVLGMGVYALVWAREGHVYTFTDNFGGIHVLIRP